MKAFQLYSHSWTSTRSSTWFEKSKCCTPSFARSAAHVARPVEQEAVPVLDRRAAEVQAGLVGEVRRAQQLALEVVGPAMDGADDVPRIAAALEHDRLPMAADVREQLDPFGVAHERLRVVARVRARNSRRARAPSARARRSRGRARTAAAARLRRLRDRNTRRREAATWRAANAPPRRDSTSACPFVRFPLKTTNPTQQPGTITALSPPRTALLSRPHEKLVKGRVAKTLLLYMVDSLWVNVRRFPAIGGLSPVARLKLLGNASGRTPAAHRPGPKWWPLCLWSRLRTRRQVSKPRSRSSRASSPRWKVASFRSPSRSSAYRRGASAARVLPGHPQGRAATGASAGEGRAEGVRAGRRGKRRQR